MYATVTLLATGKVGVKRGVQKRGVQKMGVQKWRTNAICSGA
jgi:hypothetical protein